MVEAAPATMTTLFVVSVTVMVFFTTSASRRIEQMESPNVQMLGTLTIVGSYCLLLLLGFIIISMDGITENQALFAGMKVVFAAFVIPGLILIYDHMDTLYEAYHDPDFSPLRVVLGGALIAIIYVGILRLTPA